MKIDDEIVNRIREKWSVINDIPSLLLLLNEIKSDVLLIDNELITKKKLLKFADLNNGNRYITFLVKKKSGKNRIINAPNDIEFLIILKCVNVLMSIIYLPHTNAKGFARGQSVKDNAEIHVNNAFVFNIDIIDFFNNLHQKDFIDFLHKRDYLISNHFSDTLIDIFSQLCFFKKNANIILPQGSPTSPIISNMLCHDLDICLTELAAKFQINYSRYADDITFSSNVNVFEINGELRNELVQNLQKYKFEINPSKTRVQSISERQEVTGIIVNQKLNVNKKFIKTIRMLLYYWESYGQDKANSIYLSYINSKTQNKKKKVNVKKVIEGKLAFLKMIKGEEDSVYKLLKKRYLNLIDPTTKILEISTKIETRLNLKSKIEKVNYTSRISDCFDSYPIIRFPKKDSIIRSYRNGKKNKKGVTEVFFIMS